MYDSSYLSTCYCEKWNVFDLVCGYVHIWCASLSICSKIMALLNWAVKGSSWNCQHVRSKWRGAFGQTQGVDRTCILIYTLETHVALLWIAICDQRKVPNHILLCVINILFSRLISVWIAWMMYFLMFMNKMVGTQTWRKSDEHIGDYSF